VAQVASEPIVVEPVGPEAGGEPSKQVVGRSPSQLFWRRFRRDKFAVAGVVFIVFMILLATIGAPILSGIVGHEQNEVFVSEALNEIGLPIGPSSDFWFGADTAGRDLFVRVLYGARTSLTVALVATGIALIIGVALGLIAGFYRGKVDTFVSRLIDIVLSLPILLLALGLVAACSLSRTGCLGGLIRPGVLLVSYVIGLFSWPYIARIVRGQVLSLREKEFVEAARSLGAAPLRQVVRHILPNALGPVIVAGSLDVAVAIIAESSLSFLGLGFPPDIPTWGRLLFDAKDNLDFAPHWAIFPGTAIFLTVLCINYIGDGLRDALDPRKVL
jgi:peptide/nickel transport system permease protein